MVALCSPPATPLQTWDALLLLNFLHGCPAFLEAEAFTPFCLPHYNPAANLHAYVCYLHAPTRVALVLLCGSPPDFQALSGARRSMQRGLEAAGTLQVGWRLDFDYSFLGGGAGGGGGAAGPLVQFVFPCPVGRIPRGWEACWGTPDGLSRRQQLLGGWCLKLVVQPGVQARCRVFSCSWHSLLQALQAAVASVSGGGESGGAGSSSGGAGGGSRGDSEMRSSSSSSSTGGGGGPLSIPAALPKQVGGSCGLTKAIHTCQPTLPAAPACPCCMPCCCRNSVQQHCTIHPATCHCRPFSCAPPLHPMQVGGGSIGTTPLLHFAYRLSSKQQFVMSPFSEPLDTPVLQQASGGLRGGCLCLVSAGQNVAVRQQGGGWCKHNGSWRPCRATNGCPAIFPNQPLGVGAAHPRPLPHCPPRVLLAGGGGSLWPAAGGNV